MAASDPTGPMSIEDMRKVIAFLMSKLPDDVLAELDDQLLGEAQPMAGDSRLTSDHDRRQYLRGGPAYRRAMRRALPLTPAQQMARDMAQGPRPGLDEMFPNHNRLKG